MNREFVRITRYGIPLHRHWCVGGCGHPGHALTCRCLQKHFPHSWLCYAPECNEPKPYVCGFYADAVFMLGQGAKKRRMAAV